MLAQSPLDILEPVGTIEGRSLWQDALRRLLRNHAAVVSIVVLTLIVLAAIFAPWLSPHPFDEVYWDRIAMPPDYAEGFWFGSDNNGRDLFVRCLYGARVSLAVGIAATAISLLIGVIYGAMSGFLGGKTDEAMMRLVDILYSLPFMFFVIILMVVFGRNMILLFVALGAVQWLTMARIVRGQTLSIKRQEFVQAAEAMGVGTRGILTRHIIPNTLGPVVVYMTLLVPKVILLESFLSFLGLGVQEPNTSLGVLISEGAKNIQDSTWMLLYPSLTLVAILFCLNFIGDGLRDAFDPRDH